MLVVSGLGRTATLDPDRPTVLITGSNRGIGLAFVQHYAGEGWNVLATARTPEAADDLRALAADNEHIVIEQLDVTDVERIGELAEAYRDTPIDLLINNAGIYGDVELQRWGSIDPGAFEQVMAVNVLGPLKVSEAFAAHVAASEQKKIVSITSGAGVLSNRPTPRGGLLYRVSKAALNMAMRRAQAELRDQGVIVALVAPSVVATEMARIAVPPARYADALPPAESVAGMAVVIAALDETYDGTPRNYDGSVMAW
jgi:NAD(P)-dependent dehydrogenase (short-subunit alcohol dehydrogenase family)